MNTKTTKKFVEENGIVTLKADNTQGSDEINNLLKELGNKGLTLPFVAIIPPDGGPPVSLDGLITQGDVLDALAKAGPSKSPLEKEPNLASTSTDKDGTNKDSDAKGALEEFATVAELPWQPFSRDKLDELRREGQTVLVDFTADW